MLVLASCSKDETYNTDERVICIEANSTRSYYAITDTEGVSYTTTGIACLINQDTNHPKWILSYEDIAKQLNISLSNVSTMQIAFTGVQKNGLWRFAVQFGEQEGDIEYLIDVNPDTGSIGEMPDVEVDLKYKV